jgi:hypothetical protein
MTSDSDAPHRKKRAHTDTITDRVEQARRVWIKSSPTEDLSAVESVFRTALLEWQNCGNNGWSQGKRVKLCSDDDCTETFDGTAADSVQRTASNYLSLLLCQTGRWKDSSPFLERQGYTCRLSSKVLDYPLPNDLLPLPKNPAVQGALGSDSAPCQIFDDFLTEQELIYLRSVFEHPQSDYWTSHKYSVDPPSPYFSYVFPLADVCSDNGVGSPNAGSYGLLGRLVDRTWHFLKGHSSNVFPRLGEATHVEMWAHNRPHASGHQLHFDSDNEGNCDDRDSHVRHPLISTVFYLSGPVGESSPSRSGEPISCKQLDVGGPTLVTNQRLIHKHLAAKGWLCYPKQGRLVALDGKYLHGVIPGKPMLQQSADRVFQPCADIDLPQPTETFDRSHRRVTLMLAYWKGIRVRPGELPGAARPFPTADIGDVMDSLPKWTQQLRTDTSELTLEDVGPRPLVRRDMEPTVPCPVAPVAVEPVYETLDGTPWTRKMGLPDYDCVFQGF